MILQKVSSQHLNPLGFKEEYPQRMIINLFANALFFFATHLLGAYTNFKTNCVNIF